MPFLVCLLWANVTPIDIVNVSVDVIEINTVVRFEGVDPKPVVVLKQAIFWDWDGNRGEFVVRDWRDWKNRRVVPRYDHRAKCWVMEFEDRKKWIRITSTSAIRTVTDFDPEILNREILRPDRRRRW